jgi:hypothetical protein
MDKKHIIRRSIIFKQGSAKTMAEKDTSTVVSEFRAKLFKFQ